MIFYHGTTLKSAQSIVLSGFDSNASKRCLLGGVWFATKPRNSLRIAKSRAIYPSEVVVLKCHIDIEKLRWLFGNKRVMWQGTDIRICFLPARKVAPLTDFLLSCCVFETSALVSASTLYEAYQQWCFFNRQNAMGQRAFFKQLTKRGFTKQRNAEQRWWEGIGLRTAQHPLILQPFGYAQAANECIKLLGALTPAGDISLKQLMSMKRCTE